MAKHVSLAGGFLLAVAAGLSLYFNGQSAEASWTAAVVSLCAVWWVFEPIPIPVTSLVPLGVFPLVGVLTPTEVAQAYGDPLVLLMMGGFMLSVAMERSNTHRRIALNMVQLFGSGGGRSLVFGFMTASAFLSMWISNAATTLMLFPIAMAVISKSTDSKLKTSLLLGVAYAASIGGISTPIGTPPNLVFLREYAQVAEETPSFLTWMGWGLPITLVMIPLAGLWLTRGLKADSSIELPEVGKWRTEEIRTLAVFAVTAILWMTRKDPFGGWSGLLGIEGAKDFSVALLAVVAMFIIPNGKENGEKLLSWEGAERIPWGILILYGGGIAIAKAFGASGLSETVGGNLTALASVPEIIMLLSVCLAVTFLTEVTSNTATANLLMPLLAIAAAAAGVEPKLLMFPAAISCSFAFMLPVATPPNAIAYGSNQFTIRTMAREGLALNLIGVTVVALASWLYFG